MAIMSPFQGEDGGSIPPTRFPDENLLRKEWIFVLESTGKRTRERGRENGSFPVVEILKPQGFKEQNPSPFG